MGIQMMGSQGGNQHSQLRTENSSVSGFNLTLDEIEKQLLKKSQNPLAIGSMNLDTILSQLNTGIESEGSCSASSSCMQRQGSFSLAKALSGKTVDEVWRDIQVGQKKRLGEVVKSESEETPGEMTLEDFLVKAGLFAEATFGDVVGVDSMIKDENEEIFVQQMSLSPSPSIGTTTSGMKRDSMDAMEKSERRLRRKMKNRESAARSRERKQAYLNELVSNVSCLQEQNAMLKKKKWNGGKGFIYHSWLMRTYLRNAKCGTCCHVNCRLNQNTNFEEQVQPAFDAYIPYDSFLDAQSLSNAACC